MMASFFVAIKFKQKVITPVPYMCLFLIHVYLSTIISYTAGTTLASKEKIVLRGYLVSNINYCRKSLFQEAI